MFRVEKNRWGGGRVCEGERERERDLEIIEMGGGSGREERGEGVGERRKLF